MKIKTLYGEVVLYDNSPVGLIWKASWDWRCMEVGGDHVYVGFSTREQSMYHLLKRVADSRCPVAITHVVGDQPQKEKEA